MGAWVLINAGWYKSLDAQYPKFEKLPAKMTIVFFDPRDSKGVKRILMSVRMDDGEWIQLGDRIGDNAPHEDGYRFHDVFHFAYVASMGWSPVIRSLLKRKRKSNQETDRVQDGARAANIEEAVTAYIFRYA
jgi:hypothetical protein